MFGHDRFLTDDSVHSIQLLHMQHMLCFEQQITHLTIYNNNGSEVLEQCIAQDVHHSLHT